jgi:hypothetical protein
MAVPPPSGSSARETAVIASFRRSAPVAASRVAGLVLLTLAAIPRPAAAQAEIPDPMSIPNPMMPNPGAPMTSLSVAPMQPFGGLAAQRGAESAGIKRDPDFGNLPVGPGLEDVYYTCTVCHSAQTFAQQRLTDERWAYLWEWMIREQGMPDWGMERRESILAYLTTHFSSE